MSDDFLSTQNCYWDQKKCLNLSRPSSIAWIVYEADRLFKVCWKCTKPMNNKLYLNKGLFLTILVFWLISLNLKPSFSVKHTNSLLLCKLNLLKLKQIVLRTFELGDDFYVKRKRKQKNAGFFLVWLAKNLKSRS